MPLEELEKRLQLAQTSMVYIKNILIRDGQEFLCEKVHLCGNTIEIQMKYKTRGSIFTTLFELHWYMNVLDFDVKGDTCWFVVEIPKENNS